jgi:GntR family transcriptional regulator
VKRGDAMQGLPKLNPDDYKPLYAQLSDALTLYIRTEGLKPGDPIPSESDLIRYYGTSRMTVRLAMQRLATEGLIKKVQGKGSFVAEPKIHGVIRGVRSLEDSFVEQGLTVTNHLLDASVEFPTRLFLDELNLPPGSRTYKLRRLKTLGVDPICIEVRNIPLDIAEKFSEEQIKTMPMAELMNSRPDTEIHHVNYRIVSSVLLEREAEILQVPEDSPALVQFMTHYNRHKRPLMSGRMTFLAERVEIRFEFHKNGDNIKTINLKSEKIDYTKGEK